MGNTTSVTGGGLSGYHVLRVMAGSPAEDAGLLSYFDFIISVDGVLLNDPGVVLSELFEKSEGRSVQLEVLSSKEGRKREVTLVPSKAWDASGEAGLIGAAVRWCTHDEAVGSVWHIMDVVAKSPAERAGLQPDTDYVIGTPHVTLENQEDFYHMIEEREGLPVHLLVYNTQWDTCREVVITPDGRWGGEGLLGCGVGYGLLHRVPGRGGDIPEDE